MNDLSTVLRIAVNTPLRRLFDYLPPPGYSRHRLKPGQRLTVPFGRTSKKTGLLVEITSGSSLAPQRLKHAIAVLDEEPLFDEKQLGFLIWASDYYHHPIGEVLLGTLPGLLNRGSPAGQKNRPWWKVTPAGDRLPESRMDKAPLRKAILDRIRNHPAGIPEEQLQEEFARWQKPLHALEKLGLVKSFAGETPVSLHIHSPPARTIRLNHEQKHAVDVILSAAGSYQTFLLNGITGSGKTEIYIHSIRTFIQSGHQALVLLPEIALTPQFIERFNAELELQAGILHSGLSDRARLQTWNDARNGCIKVVIGTRSAIWTPFKKLGVIVVDEEHDLSYKQQEGFRYSARDLAVIRAQRESLPLVLGSATPSLESSVNVCQGRYQEIKLTQRTGNARLPEISILDIRGGKMYGAISKPLLDAIRHCIGKQQQVLLFLNRRGYAPVMMCHGCGRAWNCPRCNIQMTYHKQGDQLRCHHCQHQERMLKNCPDCGGTQITRIGHGTQRLTETLQDHFPAAKILRIDRDSTRRKGAMQSMLGEVLTGKVDILIGTQMLAKGHHFPQVTLAGIIDVDRGLYSTDFRASERMAQIIMQVSGRAGRAEEPGRVVLQTHHPDHPLLKILAEHDYDKFSSILMEERRQTLLPPFSYQALLRAEAVQPARVEKFLMDARASLPAANKNLLIFGPMVAPMEKKAGRYRMQLLLQSQNRKQLRQIMGSWIDRLEHMAGARKVRWSLDVDPQDML